MNIPWTEKEIKLLRKIYPVSTPDELQKAFKNRAYSSILAKASKMRLKKNYDTWRLSVSLGKTQTKPHSSLTTKKEVIDIVDLSKLSEIELLEEISKRGYLSVKRDVSVDLGYNLKIKGPVFRIAVVSDTHLGSQYQQLTYLKAFYRYCKKIGIETVLHGGDLLEGDGKMYEGQLYEMFLHGTDNIVQYAIRNYPNVRGIKTIVVGGDHDYSHYRNSGYDALKAISEKRKDIRYLGMFGAYLNIANIRIYLCHGSGGVAYAVSYKMQKLIEQLAPESKPNIVLRGHPHKPNYVPAYRNVEGVDLPCFQAQTPYMRKKGLFPVVGGVILEWTKDKDGLTSFKVQFIPFYKIKEHDF
jgi:predicted phosphodiesterase